MPFRRKRRRHGPTCRCQICGQKNAGDNHNRKSYIEVGLSKDEGGHHETGLTKKETRALRRTREKRKWKGVGW